MSRRYFPSNRDDSEPKIVEALENAGWEVHKTLPVDLLCLKRVSADVVLIRLLEAKKAYGKKNPKARLRKDQKEQNEFCDRWGIKKPTNAFEALLAVGEGVKL